MSWEAALILYAGLLFFTLIGGIAIGTAMGLVGIIGITLAGGFRLWPTIGDVVWNNVNSFTLVAVPLFVLMGEIVLRSGVSRRFYMGMAVLLNRMPGGLAQSNIMACAVFSAISGSSTATALTIGTVALPEMRARGYRDVLTFGTLTGGGALGNLIPPSIFLLIYAAIVNESVVDLFVATIIPGIIVTALFMLYVAIRVILDPSLVPARAPRHSWTEIGRAAWHCLPIVLLMIVVIAGIYLGIFTPTEAAAAGCVGALLLALVYREMSWRGLYDALTSSVGVTCVVMLIIINAQILGFAVVEAGIARGVARALVAANLDRFVFFVLLFLLYLGLGTFLDGVSMTLLTVPVLYPSLKAMGFDPIWLGVILVIQAELAQLSPPVGLNLFAVQSIAGNTTLAEVSWATLPFALILCGFCFVLYWMPELALWLPQAMKR